MSRKRQNIIFFSVIFLLFFAVFVCNYFLNNSFEQYDINKSTSRDLVFTNIKRSHKYSYDKIVMGTSTTFSMYDGPKINVPRIIVYSMSYKEFYEYMTAFFDVHKETKTMYFPLELHSILYNQNKNGGEDKNTPKYDHHCEMTFDDFVRLYFNFDVMKEKIESQKAEIASIFHKGEKEKALNYNDEYRLIYPKTRIMREKTVSPEFVEENKYYIGKIIDFLKENNIKTICYIPPYNYIYLQVALSGDNMQIFNDVKKFILSKGVDIYDFSKKNRYNTEKMTETYLFDDLIHPNDLYGKMAIDILEHKTDNKELYGLITPQNVEEYNKNFEKELNEYREQYKSYIAEYNTYNCDVSSDDHKFIRVVPESEIPSEYK